MSTLVEAVEPVCQILSHLQRYDEDSFDRFNHKYSPVIFTVMAIFVTVVEYVGDRIKCWAPAEFPDPWVEYTNSLCWISNTYYIPMTQHDIFTTTRKEIVYYQWVPAALALQAFMFCLPHIFWRILSKSIGINLNKIGQLLRDKDRVTKKTPHDISVHINRALGYTREVHRGCCSSVKQTMARYSCLCGKRYGNFLIVIYMMTKLLYLFDVLAQIYLLNHFLGTNYLLYGIDVLTDLATKGDYDESRRFPRVTLCDFEVRSIGRNIPFTVQCVLPINMFNEKIFIFVWFWLALMVLTNTCGILHWLWVIFASNRRRYIKTYLTMITGKHRFRKVEDKHKLHEFCNKYLRQDGHFLLRMIGKNTSDVTVAELITTLWRKFEPTPKEQDV